MATYNELQTITRQLNLLEGRIKDLETSGSLFASGIGAGGITVHSKGSITVETGSSVSILDGGNFEVYGTSADPGIVTVGSGGAVTASGPVTFGGASSFGGNVSITGNLTVKGQLILKSGIIKANALKNQMSAARDSESTSGFTVDSTYRDKASTTVTIPAWANRAFVFLTGSIFLRKSGTNVGYTRARIESSYSQSTGIGVVGGSDMDVGTSIGYSTVVTNSGNSAKNITAAIQASGAFPASGGNTASAALYAVFYR